MISVFVENASVLLPYSLIKMKNKTA